MNQRIISAAKGGVVGFLFAGLVVICLTMTLGTVVSVLNLHSVTLSLGPIPLMSAWSDSNGYGASSGWGLGAMCYVGAAVGVVLALRRKPAGA
ncbi:MAG: hypothetical protein ABSE70_09765 [Candidatus Limnocylindrales bacterium]